MSILVEEQNQTQRCGNSIKVSSGRERLVEGNDSRKCYKNEQSIDDVSDLLKSTIKIPLVKIEEITGPMKQRWTPTQFTLFDFVPKLPENKKRNKYRKQNAVTNVQKKDIDKNFRESEKRSVSATFGTSIRFKFHIQDQDEFPPVQIAVDRKLNRPKGDSGKESSIVDQEISIPIISQSKILSLDGVDCLEKQNLRSIVGDHNPAIEFECVSSRSAVPVAVTEKDDSIFRIQGNNIHTSIEKTETLIATLEQEQIKGKTRCDDSADHEHQEDIENSRKEITNNLKLTNMPASEFYSTQNYFVDMQLNNAFLRQANLERDVKEFMHVLDTMTADSKECCCNSTYRNIFLNLVRSQKEIIQIQIDLKKRYGLTPLETGTKLHTSNPEESDRILNGYNIHFSKIATHVKEKDDKLKFFCCTCNIFCDHELKYREHLEGAAHVMHTLKEIKSSQSILTCEDCGLSMQGTTQYMRHVVSNTHAKNIRKTNTN